MIYCKGYSLAYSVSWHVNILFIFPSEVKLTLDCIWDLLNKALTNVNDIEVRVSRLRLIFQ